MTAHTDPMSFSEADPMRQWRGKAEIGQTILFAGEAHPFVVVGTAGFEGRWLICHCPASADVDEQMWCLVDFDRGIRGPDDHYGYRGYDTPAGVDAMQVGLEAGEVQVSYRNNVRLDIVAIQDAGFVE